MSLQYAWSQDDTIARWVSVHSFGHDENLWRDSTCMGVLRDGKPIAGVVFHDYRPSAGTVQYSGAAICPSWLGGATLHLMFGFMFDDLGCQMVLTGNASTNTGLHDILQRLDHKKHVIERGWGRDVDQYLWTLTREQWLQNKFMARARRSAGGIEDV